MIHTKHSPIKSQQDGKINILTENIQPERLIHLHMRFFSRTLGTLFKERLVRICFDSNVIYYLFISFQFAFETFNHIICYTDK